MERRKPALFCDSCAATRTFESRPGWRSQIHLSPLWPCYYRSRSQPARANFHLFAIEQIFSNADGTIQFIVLHQTPPSNSEGSWTGHELTATRNGAATNTFVFRNDLPSSATSGRRVLIGTQGFAALGVIAPDYTIANNFLSTAGGSINYSDVSIVSYSSLPTDGATAIDAAGNPVPNLARNFAGQSASVVAPPPTPAANYQGLWWNAPAGRNRAGASISRTRAIPSSPPGSPTTRRARDCGW